MNNPPAFPHTVEYRGSDCGGIVPHGGMTLRDYFAAKAMSYWLSIPMNKEDLEKVSVEAYKVADAMLAAREKT